jgi:AhpD family alkylhydroperoxidase
MSPRLDYFKVAPEAIKPLLAVEKYLASCGLEPSLIELVKTRASQINGCAYCLHMHTHDARAKGETEERLYLLDAWQESALYTPRERAALAWTESVTRVAQTHVPDEVFAEASAHFTEPELVNLTLLVVTINAWNRIAIGFRTQHPADARHAASARN